jgi:hypothetical protein
MKSVKDLQSEIYKLPPADVEYLAEWLAEYRARAWDSQIAEDAKPGGRLRRMVDQAKSDFRAGKTRRML